MSIHIMYTLRATYHGIIVEKRRINDLNYSFENRKHTGLMHLCTLIFDDAVYYKSQKEPLTYQFFLAYPVIIHFRNEETSVRYFGSLIVVRLLSPFAGRRRRSTFETVFFDVYSHGNVCARRKKRKR